MKGIQCYSSLPIFQGRSASGHFEGKKFDMPEAVKLCMELSALKFRQTNGTLTLYTDSFMKEYLEEQGLLECWDDINTDVLDAFFASHKNINYSVFWSAGKFAAYINERAPFVCIDTDLILWKKLELPSNLDFGFAHWESIEPGDESYPELSKLIRPEGYTLRQMPDSEIFSFRAANMSITYFGNEDFKREFAEEAIAFMTDNKAEARARYATPEILYAEQRLPLAILLEHGLKYSPIVDLTWSPKKFQITQTPSDYEHWFFSDLDTSKIFTHLWFSKSYLDENPEADREYCSKLHDLINICEGRTTLRMAKRREVRRVKAWELGAGSLIERDLIAEGAIRPEDDELYRILSRERFLQETRFAQETPVGTFAEKGDFITVNTVNGKQYPCLNQRKYFMETHQHIEGNEYDQRSEAVGVWFFGDPVSPELQYISKYNILSAVLRHMIAGNRFWLLTSDAFIGISPVRAIELYFGDKATIIFYNVKRNETGEIVDLDFMFIERDAFNRDYVFCDTQEEHKK